MGTGHLRGRVNTACLFSGRQSKTCMEEAGSLRTNHKVSLGVALTGFSLRHASLRCRPRTRPIVSVPFIPWT